MEGSLGASQGSTNVELTPSDGITNSEVASCDGMCHATTMKINSIIQRPDHCLTVNVSHLHCSIALEVDTLSVVWRRIDAH